MCQMSSYNIEASISVIIGAITLPVSHTCGATVLDLLREVRCIICTAMRITSGKGNCVDEKA